MGEVSSTNHGVAGRWPRLSRPVCAALMLALLSAAGGGAQEKQQEKKARAIGTAAGIGALLSFAMGGGVGEAAAGAAISAGVTAAINPGSGPRVAKTAKPGEVAEPKVYSAKDEHAVSLDQREWALEPEGEEEAALIAAIGEDNWEGYKALRACQHERAAVLARAGATSADEDHRLASVWLEAIIALDAEDTAAAQAACEALVERDPEVSTAEGARTAGDTIVSEMRGERHALGIGPCD